MADGSDAYGFSAVGQLVENPVGADPQRIHPAKLSSQRISGEGVTFEQSKRFLDCIYQRPAQLEQVVTGSSGENESSQRSVDRRPAIGQLAAKLGESNCLSAFDLRKPRLQGGESIGIRKDLGGLLQRLVLVDRDQGCSGSAISSHEDVIAPIVDVIKQTAEIAA
jgi:hypothetical protein